jgi:hypothetical protein
MHEKKEKGRRLFFLKPMSPTCTRLYILHRKDTVVKFSPQKSPEKGREGVPGHASHTANETPNFQVQPVEPVLRPVWTLLVAFVPSYFSMHYHVLEALFHMRRPFGDVLVALDCTFSVAKGTVLRFS